ncbi:MAG TPA: hypothetical protein VEL28_20120 [Candidatus Binatia bacterium]|nr:hypothetical protein [Candidatus Binatia bacterium]
MNPERFSTSITRVRSAAIASISFPAPRHMDTSKPDLVCLPTQVLELSVPRALT